MDTAKAKAIPGVVDIVTWEDEDIKNLSGGGGFMGPGPGFSRQRRGPGRGRGRPLSSWPRSEDICDEALRQLDVKWEVLPHVVDLIEGRKPDAPVIREPASAGKGGGGGFGMGGGNNPPKKGNVSYSNVSDGDIEAGFREADHVIEFDVNTAAFCGHIPNPVRFRRLVVRQSVSRRGKEPEN